MKYKYEMEARTEFHIKPEVAAVFDSYPSKFKKKLLALRQLILETAAMIESIGAIEETLKWGEPSYLTPKSKSGSTIRIAWKEAKKELKQCIAIALTYHRNKKLESSARREMVEKII